MKKLQLSNKKDLKLTNVLIKNIQNEELEKLEFVVEQMKNQIMVKGVKPIGPLIQYMRTYVNEEGEIDFLIRLMLQCNNYICNLEESYKMESVICIKNCIYVRYTGEESKLKYAYDKINLLSFEEDITLKGDSYTIFVDKQDENIVADVFMERE